MAFERFLAANLQYLSRRWPRLVCEMAQALSVNAAFNQGLPSVVALLLFLPALRLFPGDLTRRRKRIIQAATGEKNRVDKILQDANVKLSNVLSDLFGVSGQRMLEGLLKGPVDPSVLASLAHGRMKKKVPDIIAALAENQMREHHRQMLRFSLEHLQFLEEQLLAIDDAIAALIRQAGYGPQWDLLQSIPGVQAPTAAVLLAEVGPNVNAFESEKKLSSWAGVCPVDRAADEEE